MVKVLFLRVLIMCSFACVAPAPFLEQPDHQEEVAPLNPLEDPAARSERSTNLSFVAGTARRIQMFIKNRHLQILPDGTVNGTTDDTSVFTILQRSTVGIGQMKIQGTATCQYLCMDACGLLYGSKEFGDECVFNETIEKHYYNTYSSSKYSNDKRTFYLALNRRGQPRKVMLKAKQQLGRLSSYTRVLTRYVSPERTEELNHMRHHAHICAPSANSKLRLLSSHKDPSIEFPRCRKRKKRKKKKRKCLPSETENEHCLSNKQSNRKLQTHVKKCDSDDSSECQRETNKKKKLNSDKHDKANGNVKKKPKKGGKKKVNVVVSSEATVTVEEDSTHEVDYGMETNTHMDFDDTTALPLLELTEPSNSQTL
ncbi:uncharacterized protein LOC123321411 isoform X1 [Coccinella septempunctata]|uniref:uncharacterized protein LOC123321411 isoform X1 n=1 Tax=Coccinella septempunctata TaxID=41139 RepID=UPI001D0626FB|nr:uncharacterized protein LOC123321411 isoform X1 [Coccinella septempunctata]